METAQNFREMGFKIMATGGTKAFLEANGIKALFINKLHESRSNILDAIVKGHIDLIINTPASSVSEYDDSYICKSAIKYNIPYITTTTAAYAATQGIKERLNSNYQVKSLQEYHRELEQG